MYIIVDGRLTFPLCLSHQNFEFRL